MDALEGKRIRSYTTFVGAGGPRFWLSIEPEQRADNYAQILVHTASKEETAAIVARLREELPLQIPEARVRTQQLETGPPIGIPVQLRIYGRTSRRFANWPRRSKHACVRSPERWTSTTTGAIRCSR